MSAERLRTDLPYLRSRRRAASTPPVPPPPSSIATALAITAPATPAFLIRRTCTGAPTILTGRIPVVTLNRLQSGIGAVRLDLTCPDSGPVQLGCVYQLHSGFSSVLWSCAPATPESLLTLSARPDGQSIVLDAVRCRGLDRLIVLLAVAVPLAPQWTATLRMSTYGGTMIDVPLDRPPDVGMLVAVSLHNLSGEFVVRAECEQFAGSARDAATAYGFDRVDWLAG